MTRSSEKTPARSAALAQIAAVAALACACVLAVSVRLFSVVKYESVIHEFDPYFNFREFLVSERWARHALFLGVL